MMPPGYSVTIVGGIYKGFLMGRILVGTLAWFGFGVIAVEMVNNYDIFVFKINAVLVAVIMALVCFISQLILSRYKEKSMASADGEKAYKKILVRYYFILGLIGFIAFISIPVIWWGVMKQLAGFGHGDVKTF